MNIPTNILESAEIVIKVKSLEDLPLKNIALSLAKTNINLKGYYDCTINNVKKLFVLDKNTMTQPEFYNLPEVQEQLNIQKQNPYGSEAHKKAHCMIGEIAKDNGIFEQYQASNGTIY